MVRGYWSRSDADRKEPWSACLTLGGATPPVCWIGRQVVDCRRHPVPAAIMPGRIEAHGLDFRQPLHDLFPSPDYAVFSDGAFIPVKYLVNGDTIRQLDTASVTFSTSSSPQHDAVLSEGLASESHGEISELPKGRCRALAELALRQGDRLAGGEPPRADRIRGSCAEGHRAGKPET